MSESHITTSGDRLLAWSEYSEIEPSQWLDPFAYPHLYDAAGQPWMGNVFGTTLRMLHPAHYGPAAVRWHEVATFYGTSLSRRSRFGDLVGVRPASVLDDVYDREPILGGPPPEVLRPLEELLANRARFGLIWEGNAEVSVEWKQAASVKGVDFTYRTAQAERGVGTEYAGKGPRPGVGAGQAG
ncbi:hypothetical protein FND50_35385 [Rhodococcus sp. WB9]|uniref:hypothetical protein n=1 Tax=Rhodococcus sp. WB9 TaxID=2594007 RepID=UPI0011856978|nr:hypothetical protein [Rhodococcus sp. WB9]QDQ95479.1 hypothetical protein FND50_35385 [Rhodococcus sp. WB9]